MFLLNTFDSSSRGYKHATSPSISLSQWSKLWRSRHVELLTWVKKIYSLFKTNCYTGISNPFLINFSFIKHVPNDVAVDHTVFSLFLHTLTKLEECNTFSFCHSIAFIFWHCRTYNWKTYVAFVYFLLFMIFVDIDIFNWWRSFTFDRQCMVRSMWVVIFCINRW